ncbi:serine hydrolase [Tepidiforma sp.]|uniref:serine hydrolase n=1 Tax=Tepidiforma sp. TaxID=2682230 RepID=UPI002ADD79D5|nr:serine hydrolase [Tepidiforma sp.]
MAVAGRRLPPGAPGERVALVALLGAVAAVAASFVYLVSVISAELADPAQAPEAAANHPSSARTADTGRSAPGIAGSAGSPAGAIERALERALSPEELATAGVAVVDLRGDLLGGINPDRAGYAASTFKLAILYEAERRISAGELRYTDAVPITDEALAEDLGTFERVGQPAEDGTLLLGTLLEAMITFSDNTSAVALLRFLGAGAVDAALLDLGIEGMSVNSRELPATPLALAQLAAAIARGEGLAPEQRDHALGLLAAQEVRAGIPAGLEASDGIGYLGNKTGTWPGVTRDVAIVQVDGEWFAVAVMVDGDWNWELVQRIARAIHEGLTAR